MARPQVVLAVLYNTFIVTIRVAFCRDLVEFAAVDYVCDALYVGDIVVGIFTGFYETGSKVLRRVLVRKRYIRHKLPMAIAIGAHAYAGIGPSFPPLARFLGGALPLRFAVPC